MFKLEMKRLDNKGKEIATFEQVFENIKDLNKKLDKLQNMGFLNYKIYENGKLFQANYKE